MERHSLEDLELRFGRMARRLAISYRHAGSAVGLDADDLYQEALLGMHKHAPKWDATRVAEGSWMWAYGRYAVLDAINLYRFHNRRPSLDKSREAFDSLRKKGEDVLALRAAPTVGPAEEAEHNDLLDVLRRELEALPPKERAAVEAVYSGETTLPLARAHGVTRAAVSLWHLAGLRKLREKLTGEVDTGRSRPTKRACQ